MDGLGSGFKASHRFVLGAMFLALLPAGLAHGQTPPPEIGSGPVVASDPRANEIAGLRQQVEQMQQRLKAQQGQLDQQAIQFQQLEAQRPAVPENPSAPASPPETPVAADAPPCTADPTPAGTVPPGIVFPFGGSAAGSCYPRAILRLPSASHYRRPAIASIP